MAGKLSSLTLVTKWCIDCSKSLSRQDLASMTKLNSCIYLISLVLFLHPLFPTHALRLHDVIVFTAEGATVCVDHCWLSNSRRALIGPQNLMMQGSFGWVTWRGFGSLSAGTEVCEHQYWSTCLQESFHRHPSCEMLCQTGCAQA